VKLNDEQRRAVEDQFGVEAIPEQHEVAPNLREAFGDHTFLVDSDGLNIVESDSDSETTASVVRVASWTSDQRDALRAHDPEALPVTVALKSNPSDPAA